MENSHDKDRSLLYKNIIENNWDAIVFANMTGVVEFVNPAANELYGYEGDELIGQNVDVFNSHLTHNTEDIVNDLINKGFWHGELVQRRKDNTTFDALLHVQIITDKNGNPIGYASNSKDITSSKESAKKLKQIIAEKEILLKEVHHRVKNNLSIIQGMLRLQQGKVTEVNFEDFIIDFQTRLSVLSEAHNTLSGKSSLQDIQLGEYLAKVVRQVASLFNAKERNIDIILDFEDAKVLLDIAIPCGLIVNEVVTNSFKHALSTDQKLLCKLRDDDGVYIITISDYGKGFNLETEMDKDSMGLSLIDGLAQQLDGKYSYDFQHGTEFNLVFKS
ncbi:MAG: PAS domain S-box protein [Crocinitomicaceae bacterium]|nr:PAS domain S-box protein [Crocinitomicaceae bacterium]